MDYSDYTYESMYEDERDWFCTLSDDEIYALLLEWTERDIIRSIRENIPDDVMLKYADDKEIKELKKIRELKLINEI
jgi:hypothetical protein